MSARPKGAAAGPKAGAPKAADDPAKAREAAYKAKQEAELDEMKNQLFGGRKPAPETKASNGDADVRVLDRKEVGADLVVDGDMEDEELNFDLGELDITTQDISLDDVDDDLAKFQQDAIVKEALQKGVDLRHYSRQIENELRKIEGECVQDYVKESDELAFLHTQIKHCDTILETMEKMLSRFQGDLGAISSEIQDLQRKSVTMNFKLNNRVAAETRLQTFIKQVYVEPDLSRQITEAPLTADYVGPLLTLSEKIKFLAQPDVHGSRAADDVGPNVERLRLKAVARIRTHLLEKFHHFKSPMTNIKAKQDVLLKSGAIFYRFLVDHATSKDADVASEIRQTYVDIMAKITLDKFKAYLSSMKKLQASSGILKTDLLGVDESTTGGIFTAKRTADQLTKILSLGTRDSVLNEIDKDPIQFHAAQASNLKLPYERIFRSAHCLLMDNAIQEYDFLVDFFGTGVGKSVALPSGEEKEGKDEAGSTAGDGKSSAGSAGGGGGGERKLQRKLSDELAGDDSEHEGGGAGEVDEVDRRVAAAAAAQQAAAAGKGPEGKSAGEAKTAAVSAAGGSGSGESKAAPKAAADGSSAGAAGAAGPASASPASAADGTPSRAGHRRTPSQTSVDKVMFTNIFAKTEMIFRENLEDYLFDNFDALGLLVLIRIVTQHNLIMQHRRVTCLDHFFDRVNSLLWPKFKLVLDLHLDSIQKLKPKPTKKPSTRPHYAIVRYSEFLAGILKLCKGHNFQTLAINLERLRGEIVKLLQRCAATLPAPKQQVIFMINNYNLILRTCKNKGVESEDTIDFDSKCNSQIALYVEEELSEKFGRLVSFVKKDTELKSGAGAAPAASGAAAGAGAAAAAAGAGEYKLDDAVVDGIVKHFAKFWRDGIEQIHASVQKNFSANEDGPPTEADLKDSTEILIQVLVQLMLYYQRFHEMLDKGYGKKKPAFLKELVPIPTIKYEIKRFSQRGSAAEAKQ